MDAPNPGGWTGVFLGATTVIGGSLLWLRKWLRKDSVESASDNATIRVIKMLRDELDRANIRNESLVRALGDSNAQIDELRSQVVKLTIEVEAMRTQLQARP